MATAAARIEMRVEAKAKQKLERAATLLNKTVTDFIMGSMIEEAEKTIRNHSEIVLTSEQFDDFFTACEKADAPNKALTDAFSKARELGFD